MSCKILAYWISAKRSISYIPNSKIVPGRKKVGSKSSDCELIVSVFLWGHFGAAVHACGQRSDRDGGQSDGAYGN